MDTLGEKKVKELYWPIRTLINLTPGVLMKQLDGELIRACVAIFNWEFNELSPFLRINLMEINKWIEYH